MDLKHLSSLISAHNLLNARVSGFNEYGSETLLSSLISASNLLNANVYLYFISVCRVTSSWCVVRPSLWVPATAAYSISGRGPTAWSSQPTTTKPRPRYNHSGSVVDPDPHGSGTVA